ncbi:MAG: ferritin-like domain-containing protein [Rhodospirillaceae bacterium]|nr:MAG: ferritin-like domain-containing protein [Rhodospirillaceae bacterium]
MTDQRPSLMELAVAVLATADPQGKVERTATAVALWTQGLVDIGHAQAPSRPARPERPILLSPGAMPKRSTGPKGRIALIHALAHIEFNAIDLAWDIVVRFGSQMPRAFLDDWIAIAAEEARHFAMLADRLSIWGAAYGDLPAHDSLWEAAQLTQDDLSARLVLVPLTLEARGIDITPQTATRFRNAGDTDTAAVLEAICADEIKHLAAGIRWFEYTCAHTARDPQAAYREILATTFTGTLKGPFNLPARAEAGMGESYLAPWLT